MRACIDIGGSKLAVCLADDTASLGQQLPTLLARRQEPTVIHGDPGALADQVLRLVDAACAQARVPPDSVQAAGVSTCGPFVTVEGALALAAPNMCGGIAGPQRGLPNDWLHIPLQAPLRQRFAQLHIANDCVAALAAERRWGALQGLDHCAYVTWSTGIGMGLCVEGRLLHGKNGNAGHAGHMLVTDQTADEDALCGCGNRGDVEALVAGNAISRRFGQDAATLMAAAELGDALAQQRRAELCRVLGRALYNLVTTLDLQRIALGGSVFWHHRHALLPLLQSELTGRMPALTDGCELVAAGLGERVGDYGALAVQLE